MIRFARISIAVLLCGFMLFSLNTAQIGPQPRCPPNWLYGSAFNNCYHMSAVPRNWFDAQRDCQNMGGSLASVNSSAEYDFMIKIAYQANPFYLTWIGLKAADNTGPFRWVDQTPLTFVKWLRGEPTQNGGLCVGWRTLSDGSDGWRNIACEEQQQYICKQISEFCPNGTQTGTSGQVTSPNYPRDYTNNLNCIYQITVPIGMRVNITFDDFDCEIIRDNLTLFDGTTILSPIITVLEGHWPKGYNESQLTTGNVLTMLFHTDSSLTFKGWHGNWVAFAYNESYCSNGYLSGNSGEVSSPHYPNDYDNNLDCIYQITASNTIARLKLTFDAFNTEQCCDKLTLFDGPSIHSRQLITLSGAQPNGSVGTTYTSSSYVLTMLFHTDQSVVRSGWHATWLTFG